MLAIPATTKKKEIILYIHLLCYLSQGFDFNIAFNPRADLGNSVTYSGFNAIFCKTDIILKYLKSHSRVWAECSFYKFMVFYTVGVQAIHIS